MLINHQLIKNPFFPSFSESSPFFIFLHFFRRLFFSFSLMNLIFPSYNKSKNSALNNSFFAFTLTTMMMALSVFSNSERQNTEKTKVAHVVLHFTLFFFCFDFR